MVDRAGKRLLEYDGESEPKWSPSKRYIAGVEARVDSGQLRVIDALTGKIVMRRKVPRRAAVDEWQGDNAICLDTDTTDDNAPIRTIRISQR